MNELDRYTLDQKSWAFLNLIGQANDAGFYQNPVVGLWTPIDASGAGLTFTVNSTPKWMRFGKLVFAFGSVSYPITASGANALIGGLPFTCEGGNNGGASGGSSTEATFKSMRVASNSTQIEIYAAGFVSITNATLSTDQIDFFAIYLTA